MAKAKHNIFIPIHKIDEERRMVFGIATAEQVDKQGEICDYETSKPYYEKWSADIEKATDGKSKGNLRVMHGNKVAGTIPQILFNDVEKQIEIGAKVIDDDEWKMVMAGGYTGFSQGGSYAKKWKDGEFTRYTSNPCEISLVDNPCLASATFEVVKADGSVELRKFQNLEQNKMSKITDKEVVKSEVVQGWKATDGSFHLTKADAITHNEEIEKAAIIAADLEKAKEKSDDDDKAKEEAGSDGTDGKDGKDKTDGEATKAEESTAKADGVVPQDLSKYCGEEVYDAMAAMDALLTITYLFSNEAFEAKFNGETDSGQLADLRIVIEKLKSFIASEIMEVAEDMAMADSGDLAKAGAKISAMNKKHLDMMHKSASDHMATMDKCMKAMGTVDESSSDDEGGKAAGGVTDNVDGKVNVDTTQKSTEVDELQKKLEDKASTEELQKMVNTVTEMQKRIDSLEAQPAAESKGVRLVLKDHESEIGNGSVEADVSSILKNYANESPMIQAQKLIKAIQGKK